MLQSRHAATVFIIGKKVVQEKAEKPTVSDFLLLTFKQAVRTLLVIFPVLQFCINHHQADEPAPIILFTLFDSVCNHLHERPGLTSAASPSAPSIPFATFHVILISDGV